MARKTVSRYQFKVEENAVVHTPTGARFTAYAGVSAPHIVTKGMLGSVLKNGDDYPEDEVTAMALNLLAERLEGTSKNSRRWQSRTSLG
jgi:hypothetical protein